MIFFERLLFLLLPSTQFTSDTLSAQCVTKNEKYTYNQNILCATLARAIHRTKSEIVGWEKKKNCKRV